MTKPFPESHESLSVTAEDGKPGASVFQVSWDTIGMMLITAAYAIVAAPIALVIFPPFWLRFEIGFLYIFVAAIPILIGVVLTIVSAYGIAKSGRWKSAVVVGTVLIAALLFTTGLAWPLGRKLQCGAWPLKQGAVLRAVGSVMRLKIEAGQPLPPSIAVEVLGMGEHAVFHSACGDCRYSDVTIGRYSLVDYFASHVTIEELNNEALRTRANRSGWERMGNFTLSRDTELWKQGDGGVIAGYARIGECFGREGYNVLYADLHVSMEYADAENEEVVCATVAARRKGLPEPPVDLLTALRISPDDIDALDRASK